MSFEFHHASIDGVAGLRLGALLHSERTVADPLERLKDAHLEAPVGKKQAEMLGPELFTSLLDTLPSAMGNLTVNK
ncbi:MAG: hypothetical protein JNK92_05690 [Dechloromonas sp.]|nr:hypothetical protein [Dechloromonas sp.]